ncbi:hypothetical protein [Saccharopolyspora hattusasensis]|uniref:hypothetical protein n=1 Tax=Saccharopolyspora hattusasensis TaxID=1128679 RepID=UPI003D95E127
MEGSRHAGQRRARALCFTCGGLRKLGEPRMYVVQATEDMRTGMTTGEWRTRPQCQGTGHLSSLYPPA